MMLKALFRKQLMELNTWLIQDRRKGGHRSKGSMIVFSVLYAVLLVMVGGIFFGVAASLCGPLVAMDLGWLYFDLMGLVSVVMGVFGSVFSTYATLYLAKDNELLLSMPIPPWQILTVRLFGVWMWGAVFSAMTFLPTLLSYWVTQGARGALTAGAVLCGLLLLLVITLFVLALSGILGWVVARISVRMKNRSGVTVIVSLLFLGAYFGVYSQASRILRSILENAVLIGDTVQRTALPLYWLGRAGEGSWLSLLLITLVVLVILAAVLTVMARTFLKMATASRGGPKRAYKAKAAARQSVDRALLGRELRRFTSSANYMLNCGMSTVMLPVGGVVAIVFSGKLREMYAIFPPAVLTMLACAALCLMTGMNDLTAPSVSLEGRSLWLIQSLPVSPWAALRAKLRLHLLLTELPTLFAGVCLIIALRPTAVGGALMLAVPALYVVLEGAFGLFVNLKRPNLTWTNEVVPLKQSAGVTIAMFGSWALVAVLALLGFLLWRLVSGYVYLALCGVIFAGAAAVLIRYLKTRGAALFATL